MGKFIFSNKNKEQIIVEFDDKYKFVWDFTGRTDLDFINSEYKNKKFEELYNKLRTIDLLEYQDFTLELNGEFFSEKIKDILYRLVGYNGGGVDYEIRELLTFKFLPKNAYEIDKGIFFCKKECIFYQPFFCKKYNTYLREIDGKNTVCKMCFLELNSPIGKTLRAMHYNQVFPK